VSFISFEAEKYSLIFNFEGGFGIKLDIVSILGLCEVKSKTFSVLFLIIINKNEKKLRKNGNFYPKPVLIEMCVLSF